MFKNFFTIEEKHNHYAVKKPPAHNQKKAGKRKLIKRTRKNRNILSSFFLSQTIRKQYESKKTSKRLAPVIIHRQVESKPNPPSRETQVIILRLLLAAEVADVVLPAGLLRSESPDVLNASFGMEECLRWDRDAGAVGLVVESVLVVEAGEDEEESLKS